MKISNTQFAITKHSDRRHIHLHIVANMVDNKGQSITDSFLGLRGKKIAQQLTQQYQLVPALCKNLALTNYEALHPSEANKYKVYEAVLKVLPQCKTLQDLEKKLQLRGIEMQYKYKGQTGEKQGVTFKIGEDIFKGSKVDRQFSLGNLQKALANNQQQVLEPKQNAELNRQMDSFGQSKGNQEVLTEGIKKTVDILFTPQEDHQQTPSELLNEYRKKRKKQLKNRGGFHH
jgi:hypothetical protein